MMGGEGAFGVLTHVTLKVFRHMPETVKPVSYTHLSSINAAALSRMRSRICVPSGAAMAIAPIFFV